MNYIHRWSPTKSVFFFLNTISSSAASHLFYDCIVASIGAPTSTPLPPLTHT